LLSIKLDIPQPDPRIVIRVVVLVFVFLFLRTLLQMGYATDDALMLVAGACTAAVTTATKFLPRPTA